MKIESLPGLGAPLCSMKFRGSKALVRLKIGSLLLLSAVAATPAQAQWQEVETAHFVIVSKSKPAEVARFAERLEAYDKLMRMATNVADDGPVKVRIYEVESTDDIERALNLTDSGVAGFYNSNSLGPFAVTPTRVVDAGRYFTPALVLHHEYAHHFMLQYFPAVYPSWYIEGFAELIGSSKLMDDGRIGYGMPARHRGPDILANWVPLEELLTKDQVSNLDTYGQGWAVTHFLTFDSGRSAQLRRYLTDLGRGKSRKEAAAAFGDLAALNREARRYMSAGGFTYRPVKVDVAQPVIKRTRMLPEGEAQLIPQAIAYRDDSLASYRKEGSRAREASFRQRNLEAIREKAVRFPNDPFVQTLLAEAEYAFGNHAQSEAAADRLLGIDPANERAMVRKSILLSHGAAKLSGAARTAQIVKARALAAKANRANPDAPLPLLAYYQSFNLPGEKPAAVAVDGLMQAASMLPRNSDVRQLLVDQLARDRRFEEAIAWLAPTANSPHASPLRDAAREQMAVLKARLAAAPAAKPAA